MPAMIKIMIIKIKIKLAGGAGNSLVTTSKISVAVATEVSYLAITTKIYSPGSISLGKVNFFVNNG